MSEWKRRLADTVDDIDELLSLLDLERAAMPWVSEAPGRFQLRVPRDFVGRMKSGDPADPLLCQVLPSVEEEKVRAGFSRDPVGEQGGASRMLCKYRGRVLLLVEQACAVHCRYCFRRHFPYRDTLGTGWGTLLDEIAGDASLREVILSGGDPLLIDNDALRDLLGRIAAVPSVRCVRVHTRLPVVIPSRVDTGLLEGFAECPLQRVVVIHANHANEIDERVAEALGRLRNTGAVLLNQSVLLRGVNDSVEAISELSERLAEVGVLPYYLHMLDRVQGAAHFEVGEDEARRLMAAVAARLPGYLCPRLVREIAGAPAKVALMDGFNPQV